MIKNAKMDYKIGVVAYFVISLLFIVASIQSMLAPPFISETTNLLLLAIMMFKSLNIGFIVYGAIVNLLYSFALIINEQRPHRIITGIYLLNNLVFAVLIPVYLFSPYDFNKLSVVLFPFMYFLFALNFVTGKDLK